MEKIYIHGDIVLDSNGKHWIIDRLTLMGGHGSYEEWSYYDAISTNFTDYTFLEPDDIVEYVGKFDVKKLDKELEKIDCI